MAKVSTFIDPMGTRWSVLDIDAEGVYASPIDETGNRVWTAEELAVIDVNINNLTECA